MPIEFTEKQDGKILELVVSGKLTDSDYQSFVPEFDRLAGQDGKIRVLIEMRQLHGWEARAAWDDFKLGVKHYRDIERPALVGETKWHHVMAALCKPFTAATVRYFDHTAVDEARVWIEEGGDGTGGRGADKTRGLGIP